MKKINFAISIGSNVTSIYKAGVGVVLSDRSLVVTGLKGKREVALYVGHDALTSGVDYRKIIEKGHIDFSLAYLMLEKYLEKVEIGKKDGVLFLVPLEDMNLSNEYKNLAYSLGINNVEVLPSILATAYGFEVENFRKSFLLVDIGVNTEIAVINNARIVAGATVYNGGTNIDERIIDYIYKEKGIELSGELAEKIKNEIATLLPNDHRNISVNGFIKDTTEYANVNVSSEEIFGIIVEEYNAISSAIVQILSSCSTEVNQDIKKHGIYLCGASSKIAGIEKFFKAKLDLNTFRYRPESVTMVGAGQILDDPNELYRVSLENAIQQ